ncbi:hypothetical protein D9M70_553480 [compost metagenome]
MGGQAAAGSADSGRLDGLHQARREGLASVVLNAELPGVAGRLGSVQPHQGVGASGSLDRLAQGIDRNRTIEVQG